MDTRHMPKNAVWWVFCIISACRLFSGVSTALQFSKFIIWQVAAKACLHYCDSVSQSNPRPYRFKNRPRVCGAFLDELKLVQVTPTTFMLHMYMCILCDCLNLGCENGMVISSPGLFWLLFLFMRAVPNCTSTYVEMRLEQLYYLANQF